MFLDDMIHNIAQAFLGATLSYCDNVIYNIVTILYKCCDKIVTICLCLQGMFYFLNVNYFSWILEA